MTLSHLQIRFLRNLREVAVNLDPGLNCLLGANGSGKTSVLEAVYLLSLGRSFRSAQLNRLIQHGANELLVFAEWVEHAPLTMTNKVGFSRNLQGDSQTKINGNLATSSAELVRLLPTLLLYSESYTLFRDSPKTRRKWLDWGVFHVEHLFFPLWKKLQKILAQRNALLRQMAPVADIVAWDAQLAEIAEAIHQLRAGFIAQWQDVMQPILQHLFGATALHLTYTPGWDVELGLLAVLKQTLSKDRALGYTTRGPQRADIQIYAQTVPAQHILSLGQQKLLVSGIVLSQASLISALINKSPLLLIDDLPAELDEQARERIAHVIHTLDAQILLTAVDPHTLLPFRSSAKSCKMFHVEQGTVSE